MHRLIDFVQPGEDGNSRVLINPAHVQSVVSSDYDGIKCCEIALASGEKHYVLGDYGTVTGRLKKG